MWNWPDASLALVGIILLIGGWMLWRTVWLRQRVAQQDPLRELQQERAAREQRPESLVQEMELRLFDYGREVEGRVETTLNVLDQLILDAEQEIQRLETLLQASHQKACEAEWPAKIERLITAGLTDAEIVQCLGCPLDLVRNQRQLSAANGQANPNSRAA